MDDIVLIVGFEDADFEKSSSSVGSDEHREIGLVGPCDRNDCVVDCMANGVIRDPVLASTRSDLHCDNLSCRWRPPQPTGARTVRIGTGGPPTSRPAQVTIRIAEMSSLREHAPTSR